jgi:myo-inositol-1-phosphate synthase
VAEDLQPGDRYEASRREARRQLTDRRGGGAGGLDIPDLEAAIYRLYSLALYPHLIHAAYGTRLDPELSRKLVTSGVDMFLSYYHYKAQSVRVRAGTYISTRTLSLMIERVKVAVIGVGNDISALVQGIAQYRTTGSLVGIHQPILNGLGVGDIDFVAAFAISPEKIGRDLAETIFMPPNNFPRLTSELPRSGVTVRRGLTDATEVERVAAELAGAEVVLYAAPSGRQETAQAYAEAALRARAAFINTTSDAVARDPQLLDRFAAAGLPLLGDDLTSQFGTSVLHHALLRLLEERGLTLVSSYQVNLGGTEDFRNLVENSNTKLQSKLNALTAGGDTADRVQVAPLGYLPHLRSQKVAHINIEAQAWGETSVSLDVKLKVHDPSGAAGVTVDLVRMAAGALRAHRAGYLAEATPLLKSPPGTFI